MPVSLDPITLISGQSISKQLPNAQTILAIEVMNKSSFDIQVEGISPSGSPWQPSGTTKWYFPGPSCTGNLVINSFNTAQLSNPPTSVALVTVYLQGDKLPDNTDVATIPTQVVQANVSTISVLQNLRQSAGTQWLLVTDSNNNTVWSADNNGNLFVGQEVAGAVTTLLQFIAGGNNPIELLGNLVNWDKNGNYNGQNLNLGSRKVLSIQNGLGAAGNVVGVDSNDNTFIQHNSNNQTLLYDKNGNPLITWDGNGNTIYKNNTALKWKDTGNNTDPILQVNNFNQTQLFGINGADVVQFLKHDGTIAAIIDLVNQCLNLSTSSIVINGGVSGSATHWMPFQGSGLKLVIVKESNFQTSTSNQDYTLPTAFTNGAFFLTGSVVTWSFLNSGVAQNCNVVTAIGTSSFQSTVGSYTFGNLAPDVAFNGIRHGANAASAHTGWIVIIGI